MTEKNQKLKNLVHDFADKSTIAGLHYVFDRNQVSILCFNASYKMS